MPKLPLYQPQVANTITPISSSSPEASAMAGVSNALSDLGNTLGSIRAKQQERHQRLSRVSANERARNSAMQEFNRIRVEEDITDPATFDAFNENISSIIDDEIVNHNGSEDSRAALTQGLMQLRSSLSLDFMKEQTSAQLQQAGNIINRKSLEYTDLLYDRPDALAETLVKMDEDIDETIGLDLPGPQVEMMKLENRTKLVSSAFNSIASMPPSDAKVQALNDIINDDMVPLIDQNAYSNMRISLYKAQSELDQFKARAAATVPNDDNFKKLNMAQFLHDNADAYTNGTLSPIYERTYEDFAQTYNGFDERVDPITKQPMFLRRNPLTDTVRNALEMRGRSNLIARPTPPGVDDRLRTGVNVPVSGKPEVSLYERAINQSGPVPAARRTAEGFFLTSPFVKGEQDVRDYQDVRNLGRDFIVAMQKNKNYAVKEMERLTQLFNFEPSVFGSKSAMRERLNSIDNIAMVSQARAFDEMNNTTLPAKIREAASIAYSDLLQFRTSLGAPTATMVLPGSSEEVRQNKINKSEGVRNTVEVDDTLMQRLNSAGYF